MQMMRECIYLFIYFVNYPFNVMYDSACFSYLLIFVYYIMLAAVLVFTEQMSCRFIHLLSIWHCVKCDLICLASYCNMVPVKI